jgi:putative transposase
VLTLRKQYPCWGRDKLVVLLAREKLCVSVSMVGRILSALKRRGALHEPPKPAVLLRQHRKLRKRPWAVRKPKYWPLQHPGDLVEIDTKEIRMRRGVLLKHFSARDVVSRWDVDGGSEFAAEFELVCQQKQLPLFVLPPKSPKLNAHVERSHRTHNEEFYQVYADSDQPPRLNQLRHWEHTYNCVRPHQSLAYLTLLEFVTRWKNNRRKAKCH